MKKLSYSLVTLAALGALHFAYAEDGQNTEDKTIPPSTKTSLLEALQGTTIGGYAYGQVTSMFGSDADGTAMRLRTWIDLNTGAYHGFSIGTAIYASIGGSSPNGGTFIRNSGFSPYETIPVGLRSLYGRKTFESSATVITAGKITLATPFSDTSWDSGYGVSVDNYDVKGLGFHLQAYGAWALDNGNSIPGSYNFVDSSLEGKVSSGLTSENGLFILGISGDQKEFAGVGFDVWAAHSIDTIDFLTFVDLNYTISGLTLQTQVATTQVETSSRYFHSTDASKTLDLSAKLRGLYNLQLTYNSSEHGFKAAVGYTGSFGDGYGALLNNVSSFNMGGKIWYDTLSSGANGYGITGVGGFKNKDGSSSTIQVAYASIGYKGTANLSLGLDYAWVSGDNNYALMKKGSANNQNMTNMNATFHEVSLSMTYAFTDKLSMSVLGGSTFGDLQMGRARMRLNYSF
ncbi:major outer membrane protein [Helicobacter pametensis]|uniref:major outer membrane protein n=1 Tax=Helicobacter pametensis TaxID=95149 RepID=UPI000482AF09|nr:major outer membrane protein [Helicobacter pametensis]